MRAILAFWIVHFCVLMALSKLSGATYMLDIALRRVPFTMVAMLLCYAIYRILQRRRADSFWRLALTAGALALVAAAIYGLVTTIGFAFIAPIRDFGPYQWRMFLEDSFIWLYSFFSWAAIHLAMVYSFEVGDRERRLAQVEALAHQAQVHALRYQVNPHFLFNTLNSISSMIWERELQGAEAMLVSLSAFLRTTLEIDPAEDVTLSQEIALQKLYLEIEQIRFSERLTVEIDIPLELQDARVPSLILQPLVENVIKYAVAPSKQATRLRIAAKRCDDRLMLHVEDDGAAAKINGGTGVGLHNVRQRLATRFGESWTFDAGPTAQRGFRVTLGMPLQYAAQ
ncbi:sensor histidine kinase [Sphingomonas sp. LaA6.9]|uniref:sensor histidine kinase n=1 Tax=Sphingomonas sp. LaA6.9 TaxID=2919914 RepID=UPI001F500F2A|nr:histidine kinase [Sphingomonas sp. LaA6.9]MCJ8158426.1 histidine kinase [Sphingomonas sp. LaA6.9]